MKAKQRLMQFVLCFSLVLSLGYPAMAQSDRTSTASVSFKPGNLTIESVPSIHFGEQQLSARDALYPAESLSQSFCVIDARGSLSGWSVKANLSRFQGPNGDVLAGSSILISSGENTTQSVATPPSYVAQSVELISGDTSSQSIWTANLGEGNGIWEMEIPTQNINLYVPYNPNPELGTFQADLYWTLIDAPAN